MCAEHCIHNQRRHGTTCAEHFKQGEWGGKQMVTVQVPILHCWSLCSLTKSWGNASETATQISTTWHHSWTKNPVLSVKSLSSWLFSELNNIGAFTGALSEFSAGCAGKERHMLLHADGNQCPCCTGDSMANKGGYQVWCRLLPVQLTSNNREACYINPQHFYWQDLWLREGSSGNWAQPPTGSTQPSDCATCVWAPSTPQAFSN